MVHGSWSSQSAAFWHCTQPSFASHSIPWQRSLLGVWVQPFGPQASSVQPTLSLHSLSSQHTAQLPELLPPEQHLVPIAQGANSQTPPLQLAVWQPEPWQSEAVVHLSVLMQPSCTSQT